MRPVTDLTGPDQLRGGAALVAPFFVEPWIWPVYNGYYQGLLGVWVG